MPQRAGAVRGWSGNVVDDAVQGRELDRGPGPASIRSNGTLTVAADATYAPNEFIGSDGHTVVGMESPDPAQALGQVMGLKVKMVNATFDTIIPGLVSGKYDLGMSSFTDTKARQQTVDFVTYFIAGTSFYVKSSGGPSITSLAAWAQGRSGKGNDAAIRRTQAQAGKCTSAGKSAVNVEIFNDQTGFDQVERHADCRRRRAYAPMSSSASDGHTVVGMDADLAQALDRVMGLKVKMVNVMFDTTILVVSAKMLGMSSFTIRRRQQTVDFVDLLHRGTLFYVRSSGGQHHFAGRAAQVAVEGSRAPTRLSLQAHVGRANLLSRLIFNDVTHQPRRSDGRTWSWRPASRLPGEAVAAAPSAVRPAVRDRSDGIVIPKNNGMAKPYWPP